MTMFHLAIPSHNLEKSKDFYEAVLNQKAGRAYKDYVVFNFFGHQLVCHLDPTGIDKEVKMYPRHFGIIFDTKETLLETYQKAKESDASFYEDLFERFVDQPGWHWSFFLIDPSNNLIEFKYYQYADQILNTSVNAAV